MNTKQTIVTTLLALVLNATGSEPLAKNTVPEIDVQFSNGYHLTSKSDNVDVGWSPFGGVKYTKILIIKNRGGAPLTGLEIRLLGVDAESFTVTQPGTRILNPGKSTTFKVKLKAGVTSMRSARIKLLNNDPDENPFVISLTGWGGGVNP